MSSKEKVMYMWERPQKVVDYEADILRKRWKIAGPVVLICVAVVGFTIYMPAQIIMQRYVDELDWSFFLLTRPFLIGLVFTCCGVFFLCRVAPWLYSKRKYSCKIDDDGITIITGSQARLCRWNKIKEYWLSGHEQFPEISVLNIRVSKMVTSIYLPVGEVGENVVNFVSERAECSQDAIQERKIELGAKHYTLLAVFVPIYSLLMVSLSFSLQIFLGFGGTDGTAIGWSAILLLTMFVGPGTLVLAALHGKEYLQKKELHCYAIFFNLFTVFLYIVSVSVVWLISLSYRLA